MLTIALTIADDQARISGGSPATGISRAAATDLASSAQWGRTGPSIARQG